MKVLVLCVCVLALAVSNFYSAATRVQLKNAIRGRNSASICLEQNNMAPSEWYTARDIALNHHTEPENEERTRKNGCAVECIFKKMGMMEGRNFVDETVYTKIEREIENSAERPVVHRILNKCLTEARDITEECKKGLALYVCVMKSVHEIEEHEHHEHVPEDV
ncbi:ObirObp14 [Ooceraea biroi]|uniref:Pheromone-binding protein Gp-9 n=1 Tax=Ooceraea biroi TaxID=2015173 RepID=A0A3L8DZI4_OOCBI|nr:ObirObp14 [Ooceraea biroi]